MSTTYRVGLAGIENVTLVALAGEQYRTVLLYSQWPSEVHRPPPALANRIVHRGLADYWSRIPWGTPCEQRHLLAQPSASLRPQL